MTDVERLALRMWREREMRFPPFVRRMVPDAWDRASGAWALMLEEAAAAATSALPAGQKAFDF